MFEITSDGNTIIIGNKNGVVYIVDNCHKVIKYMFETYCGSVNSLQLLNDRHLGFSGQDDQFFIYDFKTGNKLAEGGGHSSWINTILPIHTIYNDDKCIIEFITSGDDSFMNFWVLDCSLSNEVYYYFIFIIETSTIKTLSWICSWKYSFMLCKESR